MIQSVLSLSGFYLKTDGLPPRFGILLMPPLLFIASLFFTNAGKRYIDKFDPKFLTLLHIIRIPIELVLYFLYLNKTIPGIMTFEGRNFDILSGVTAFFIFHFGFVRKTIGQKLILLWNFICLGLLINIVMIAILSAPFPFQKLAFDQPDIAILHFPFVWLSCCIVPLVLLSHLIVIKQQMLNVKTTSGSIAVSK